MKIAKQTVLGCKPNIAVIQDFRAGSDDSTLLESVLKNYIMLLLRYCEGETLNWFLKRRLK